MITFDKKGDFSKTIDYLNRLRKIPSIHDLKKYGKEGVEALSAATPVDTGLTASSWDYKVTQTKRSATIAFFNTNIQNGVPIAIVLQYGHGTRNGSWVEGRDYINPAIQPIFDKIANDIWKEVRRV